MFLTKQSLLKFMAQNLIFNFLENDVFFLWNSVESLDILIA